MNFSQLSFGDFALKIHGFFLALAFLVATWHFYKKLEKEKFNIEFFIHHFWRWVLGGILLGRLFAVLVTPEIWGQYGIFSFFAFWEGGTHELGAIIGFLIALLLDFKLHKISVWKWLDIGIFSFLIGYMIVDVSGFLTGEIYGTETGLFWGVAYETFGVGSINPVHPVTLYGLVLHLWLFFFLNKKSTRWINLPGKTAIWGIFIFFIIDFFIQFFRADPSILIGILRIEQLIDIVLILLLWWWIKSLNFKK